MDFSKMAPTAVALGILYGITHFAKNEKVKAACYGAMGVIVLKQVPYVKDVL